MFGKLGLATAFVAMTALPALAAQCNNPVPPEISVDGTTATALQMTNAIRDFKSFQSASDDYQSCLYAELDAEKRAAAKKKDPKPLDPAIVSGIQAKVQANQAEKVKLGGELNTQIIAYQNAHKK